MVVLPFSIRVGLNGVICYRVRRLKKFRSMVGTKTNMFTLRIADNDRWIGL